MKNMYFKIFTVSINTEREILKKGFKVNSCSESNVYNGLELEGTFSSSKDYILQGNVWEFVDCSPLSERFCCIAKTPLMSFDELWDLFTITSDEDDRIGSLLVMYKKHYALLIKKYKALLELEKPTKNERRTIKKIMEIIK